jgi:hypothetical protein
MQLALEALEKVITAFGSGLTLQQNAITALRKALETEQEPVLWLKTWSDGSVSVLKTKSHAFADHELEPLYAAPPKQWVGLTEREVELIDEMIETQLLHAERCDHMANSTMAQKQKAWDLERVELLRKLKEKNT